MEQLNEAREEHGFTDVLTTDGRILFKHPMKTKVIYFMIRNYCGAFALYMNGKACVVYVRIYFLFWEYYALFSFIKKNS